MLEKITTPSSAYRVLLALGGPILGALLLAGLFALLFTEPTVHLGGRTGASVFLGGAGLASLLLGLRWYGLRALGLRGKRPLYASIGFATLGWISFLLARLLVGSNSTVLVDAQFGRVFLYLFLFEALAVQLWTFGLLFRTVADWRGPLTAAISSGILFGAIASQFFSEAYINTLNSLLYFTAWGIFYGLIRLRTGSILGTVIVQALQSLTAWHILLPEANPMVRELHNLYLVSGTLYLIFVWRLWPTEEEDYRV